MTAMIDSPRSTTRSANDLIAKIEAALPELQTYSLQEEKAGQLTDHTIEKLAEIGVFDISIPAGFGGSAMNTSDQLRVYTAVAQIAGSTGWVTWVTTTHVRWVTMFSRQAQKEVFGMDWPAPRVSGVIGPTGPGKARIVEGGYMLKGKWPFCSGCRHTAWSILGGLCEMPDGSNEVILSLVPYSDLAILDDWRVSGMKASGSNTVQIAFEAFVPQHRTLGLKDAFTGKWASEPPDEALYKNDFGAYTTLLSGATPLGMAKGALSYYMTRIGKRGISSTDYHIQADAPVTQLQLVEAVSRIDAAEMVLAAEAKEIDRRGLDGEPCDDLFRARVRYNVAKSVRDCSRAIEILHRGCGASSILEQNPMQRYARDARVATVHAQFNYETCAEDYGRALCGKPIFGNFLASDKAAA